MNRVEVTRSFVGIYYMQVCAEKDASDKEILEVCNRENISGTTNGWMSVLREDSEHPPVACQDNPSRLHFLVSC